MELRTVAYWGSYRYISISQRKWQRKTNFLRFAETNRREWLANFTKRQIIQLRFLRLYFNLFKKMWRDSWLCKPTTFALIHKKICWFGYLIPSEMGAINRVTLLYFLFTRVKINLNQKKQIPISSSSDSSVLATLVDEVK